MQPITPPGRRGKRWGCSRAIREKIEKDTYQRFLGMPETLPPYITGPLISSRDDAFQRFTIERRRRMQACTRGLKFEELFYVQLNILRYASDHRRKYRGYIFPARGRSLQPFYQNNLQFELTGAQKRVMHEIRADMCSGKQMNRLCYKGDVGSGAKRSLALMSMLIAIDNGFLRLASWHRQSSISSPSVYRAWMCAWNCSRASKARNARKCSTDLSTGQREDTGGTHAIIEDPVQFAHLGPVVDEQHRFGVKQRRQIVGQSDNPPHVLVMTEPSPHARTIYGDLDVNVIDEATGPQAVQTIHRFDR